MTDCYIYFERDGKKCYVESMQYGFGAGVVVCNVIEEGGDLKNAMCLPEEIAKEKIATWQPYYNQKLKLERRG